MSNIEEMLEKGDIESIIELLIDEFGLDEVKGALLEMERRY